MLAYVNPILKEPEHFIFAYKIVQSDVREQRKKTSVPSVIATLNTLNSFGAKNTYL